MNHLTQIHPESATSGSNESYDLLEHVLFQSVESDEKIKMTYEAVGSLGLALKVESSV